MNELNVKASAKQHASVPAHKAGPVSKLGESGHRGNMGKSHEADVSLGEGVALGGKHTAHEKHQVRTTAKEDASTQGRAHADAVRRENGNANPSGDNDVQVKYGLGSTKPLHTPGAHAKALANNVRREQGKANPSAAADGKAL